MTLLSRTETMSSSNLSVTNNNSPIRPYLSTTSILSRTTTSHTTSDQSLSSFAPEILKHILSQESSSTNNRDGKIRAPYVKTFEGVGFFADVSGFTKATESLSNAMGDLGTEILAHKINAYLPQIAKKIVASGGDVVKFAGDALLCIWPPPPETLFNQYEEKFKSLEKKWRKYQDKTDKQRAKINSHNNKINELNKEFEDIKTKYLTKKFENETQQKEKMKSNCLAAIKCAIDIQETIGRMDLSGSYYEMYPNKNKNKNKNNNKNKRRRKVKNDKIEFRVKLGIGIGKIHLLIVGGNLGRCEYLICGDGLIQAFDCENDCKPELERMIVVSEKVSKIEGIKNQFLMKRVEHIIDKKDKKKGGHASPDLNNYAILGINKKSKPGTRKKIGKFHYGHLIPDSQNQLATKLTDYVPAAVKPHLDMPQQIWTGELREVTILFVSLPWNARSFARFHDGVLKQLQKIIYTLQEVIYKYQGSLNKFLIDDKGSTVMAVFGLPPVAHENDPTRAVLAALELRERIGSKSTPAAIGISTGTVFVGIIGSRGVRREYGILGDKVNLSARLMGMSKKNPVKLGEVIVDNSVYIRSKKEIRIEWTDLNWIWVKGKAEKVHIWRPARNNIPLSAHKLGQAVYLETSDKVSLKNINHEIELFLSSNKENPSSNKQKNGRVILVEGEIGIGKSSLLGQIQVRNSTYLWFLWGKANEFHECLGMDYIVWKQILLGFSSRYSLITQKNRFLFKNYVKQRRPDLIKWLFLINDLIDLGNYKLLEDEFLSCTYSADNKEKYDSIKNYELDKYRHDIVFILLEWTARIKPIAIIIDELQYLTKKDWQITRRLCFLVKQKILKNIILFLGSTPIDNQRYRPLFSSQKLINKFSEIRQKYSHKTITPCAWGYNKTKFFIKKYFDIGDCSERVVMTVHSQCGGRPGFCEQFLSELTAERNHGQYIRIFHKKYLNSNKNMKKHQHASYHIKQQRHDSNKKLNFNSDYNHNLKINKHMSLNNITRNEMYCTFDFEIDARFKIGLDVIFPIPSNIMQITLSHVDKLKAEESFILKVASVICKSKGNNSIQFEEHMIRGCHPLPETGMNAKKRLRSALNKLCEMQFIYKLKDRESRLNTKDDDIGIDLDVNDDKKEENNQQKQLTMKKLTKVPSYNNFDFEPEDLVKEQSLNGGNGSDKKGNKTKNKNNHQSEEDINHIDLTEFDGITDPMPATKALLQEPAKCVPYKRGKMFKRGVNFINMTETQRIFVFKHRTLYWIKDENEEYPRSRIKFDQSVQKLKREDMRSISIKTPRKEYILRCNKKRDMDEWFKLFTEALRANFLNDTMMKRMKQFGEKNKDKKKSKSKGSNNNNGKFNMHDLLNGAGNKTSSPSTSSPQTKKYNKRHSDKISSSQTNTKYKKTQKQTNTPPPKSNNKYSSIKPYNFKATHQPKQQQQEARDYAPSVVDVDYGKSKAPTAFDMAYRRQKSANKYGYGDDDDKDLDQFDDCTHKDKISPLNPSISSKRGVTFGPNVVGGDEEDTDEDDELNAEELQDVVHVLRTMSVGSGIDMGADADFEHDDDDEEEEEEEEEEETSKTNSSSSSKDKELSNRALDKKISSQLKVHISKHVSVESNDDPSGFMSSDEEYDVVGVQSGDSVYEFGYGFLRDIVYEQMLYNQRKQLHTNALNYIAKCLEEKNDDKLALLHTRHIECVQRYADMLQGDDSQKQLYSGKRSSFFSRMTK